MRAYRVILKKVVLGFMALYLVMMFVFTYSKQIDVQREYENHIFDILNNLEGYVKDVYTKTSWSLSPVMNEILTKKTKYSHKFNMYGAAAVFKEGECIGKSGNYLVSSAVDWYLNPKEGGNKYIDLEAYLSEKQLIELLGKIREIIEDDNKIIWIRAGGYSRGQEVLPTTIEVLEIERSKDGSGWKDEDAQVIVSYEFDKENVEGLESYYLDNWNIESTIDLARYSGKKRGQQMVDAQVIVSYEFDKENVEGLESYYLDNWNIESTIDLARYSGKKRGQQMVQKKMTKATFDKIKKLEARLYQWEEEGYEWKKTWNEVTYSGYFPVETETGDYTLALTLQYQPWSVALKELKIVYLFSGLAGSIMSLILTGGLWKAEKKQLLLEKNRRVLIDAIGHELKTPLGIIEAYSEGLREKIAEDKKDHYLAVMIDEIQKMDQLILEMLQLSKLESNAYMMNLEQLSLNHLIKSSLKNKQKLFEDKQIQLKTNLEEETEIVADHSGMEKVMNNLLMNAIEHTPVGGTIEVRIKQGKVSVQNEGKGIPKEKMNQIWESFYKVEEANNRSGNGVGLGLAITRQILEKHHMTYGVKNTDQGVEFWFMIKK